MWWYWVVPIIVSLMWFFHLADAWLQPQRVGLAGWLVLVGPPATILIIAVSSTILTDTPDSPGTQGSDSTHGLFSWPILVIGELLLAWVACLFLESILIVIRAFRRRNGAPPVSDVTSPSN